MEIVRTKTFKDKFDELRDKLKDDLKVRNINKVRYYVIEQEKGSIFIDKRKETFFVLTTVNEIPFLYYLTTDFNLDQVVKEVYGYIINAIKTIKGTTIKFSVAIPNIASTEDTSIDKLLEYLKKLDMKEGLIDRADKNSKILFEQIERFKLIKNKIRGLLDIAKDYLSTEQINLLIASMEHTKDDIVFATKIMYELKSYKNGYKDRNTFSR